MCGIVGILGNHEAAPILLEALRRLEYRGYDSAGIATVRDGALDRRRAEGKLAELSDLLVHEPLAGRVGIGHTRWATHGVPSVGNAHPQQAGPVAVVHNGIIENHAALRADLAAHGYVCESETDTEIVALLARQHLEQGLGPVEAARATVARLDGAFALAFLFEGEDDLIVAARRGSPLAVGHGDGEMFVGSDAIALAPLTDRVTYLEEGDFAVIRRAGLSVFDETGAEVERTCRTLNLDAAMIDKGGHKYFMAKELAEQPSVFGETLAAFVSADGASIDMPDGVDFAGADRLVMTACGTAFYACLTAKYWFERFARLPVEVDIASEFRYREPPMAPGDRAVFVSQSGETADTLAAQRYARGAGARILSVVNVPESSIARESDVVLPTRAGAEIGVASTKAFTCQLGVLALLALKAAEQRGTLDAAAVAALLADLRGLPGAMNTALTLGPRIAEIALELAEARDVLFLGRGHMYPMALEGALKLKEISYIHAEGYASGELKHGPIALIDQRVPVVVLAPSDALLGKSMSNLQEVMARHGRVLMISDADAQGVDGLWHHVRLPVAATAFAPILYAIPLQLLAYHTAVARGTDVDQPRNLAKSVTVE